MKTKFKGILTLLLALVVQITFAQEKTVSGTVSDASGSLPGVSVVVKGTSNGTETDFDGNYSISTNTGDVLVFSYLGYKTVEQTVGSSNIIDVTLEEGGEVLDEIVVTAFGREKEKDKLGYAISNVGSEEIQKTVDPNVLNSLTGRVAGVSVTSSSGGSGSSSNIIIRGTSSISGNNQALFVVDGMPIDNSTLSTGRGSYGTNRAGDIDPSIIENISILKGGAATALYGERAANGVVLITTKSGKGSQKGLNVQITSNVTIGTPNKYHSLSSKYARGRFGDYSNVTHWNWGPAYSTNPTFPTGTLADLNGTGTRVNVGGQRIPQYFDNYKNFFVNSYSDNQSVNVKGANEKGNLSLTISRNKDEGVVRNNSYERYNFSFSGGYKITDKFSFKSNVQFVNSNRISSPGLNGGAGWGSGMVYYHNMWDLANRAWKGPDGTKTWFSGGVVDPMWIVNETNENNDVKRIIGNINLAYNFNEHLNLSYRIGVDSYSDVRKRFRPFSDVGTTGATGSMYDWGAQNDQIDANLNLTGAVNLTGNIKLNYLGGLNINERKYDGNFILGSEQVVRGFENINNYKTYQIFSYQSNRKTIGVYSELAFDYKDFLLLTLTGRNDWASTLPSENRSFFYPSVSSAFIFSKLIENKDILSFGKLRASWAKVGKAAPLYSLADTFDKSGTNSIGDQPQAEVSDIQKDANIKPEISSEFEIGTELKFLNNKINLDLTYYKKTTVDQHVFIPLAQTTGYSSTITNAGTVENSGIEALLGFRNLFEVKDLDWGLSFNFTQNKNKAVELPTGVDQIILTRRASATSTNQVTAGGWWTNTNLVARKGLSLGTIVGSAYKRDANGNVLVTDGVPVTETTDQIIGDAVPDFVLGINGDISYKGFELSWLFEIRQGGDVINDAKAGFIYGGLHSDTDNRWYPSAADANVGRPTANGTVVVKGIDTATNQPNTKTLNLTNDYWANTYRRVGENFVEDASWLRLRNVTLGYTLPNELVSKIGFTSVKLSVTGQNLWLSTDYTGHDPETSGFGAGNFRGFDVLSAPSTRTFSLGVKLNF